MKDFNEISDAQSQATTEDGRRHLDPFCELRTMPAYWDVSGLMSAENNRSSRLAGNDQEAYPCCASEPAEETLLEWQGNPFPKLRTFPSYWDLP
jgi:hypothetical protein